MSTPGASTLCAEVIIDELIMLGVREVVLSPGSRSAPLAYAVWRAAQDGRIRVHVRIDERTAGFLALGLAKGSAVPVAVFTTSGTAPAHLHPAVLEAWHSAVPMIMITADRPATMINTGANQTTDQIGLFGGHVLGAGRIAAVDENVPAWRTAVRRLLIMSSGVRSRRPGPVHLDVELVDPLTPSPVTLPPRPDFAVTPASTPGPVELPAGPRTVVLAGDAPPAVGAAARELAEAGHLPLLAEPSSNARSGDAAISAYRLLLDHELATEIERVIVVGHPTLSRPALRLLGRADVELIMVATTPEWIDPGWTVDRVVDGVVLDPSADLDWLARWRRADTTVRTTIDAVVGDRWNGWAIAAAVWWATTGSVLVAGSSQTIRDLDLAPTASDGPTVFANRGLSGIDGTLSTAAGVALTRGEPTTALVGDLTFLHDLTGLVIGPAELRPDLRIVVVNDDGGAIFHTLEQGAAEHADAFERVFGTPHGADLGALVRGLGHRHVAVHAVGELAAELARPITGVEVVECRLDRQDRRRLDQALRSS